METRSEKYEQLHFDFDEDLIGSNSGMHYGKVSAKTCDYNELECTVEPMLSSSYKDRFVAEYLQTKIRYDKLHKMIVKYEACTLDFTPETPVHILEEQAKFMGNYLRILEIRAEIEKIDLPRI